MLRNAWVIPVVPVLSFWLILFFGKKLPRKGAEIGVATLGVCLLLSIVLAGQWISREETVPIAHHGAATEHAVEEDGHGPSEKEADEHAEDTHEDEHTATTQDSPLTEDEHGGEVQGGGGDEELRRAPVERKFTWWESGSTRVTFGSLVDGLS